MGVIVIGSERSIGDLDRRILRSGVSDAEIRRIHRAVREANPGVDLDHLRPGTVLTLPPSPHVRELAASPLDDSASASLKGLLAASSKDIAARRDEAAETMKAGAAQRREMAKQLGSAKVRRVIEKVPELRESVEAAREELLRDAEVDTLRAEIAEQVTGEWEGDLAALQRMLR